MERVFANFDSLLRVRLLLVKYEVSSYFNLDTENRDAIVTGIKLNSKSRRDQTQK